MLAVRWSVQSPWSASALADRIRAEPRWNGWRDGLADGRFLIAEYYPVEVGPDGFRFVVPSSPKMFVVCRGRFHSVDGGTHVELAATPLPAQVVALAAMCLPILAICVVGLWSVSLWLAIGAPVTASIPFALFWAAEFVTYARHVRRRVDDFLTQAHPQQYIADAEPGAAPDPARM